MSYERLTKKVRQAEQALEARERSASASWRVAKTTWKEAWTPGRIAAVGAIAGFMFGRSRRKSTRSGHQGIGLIRLATSVVGLMSTLQVKSAAGEAEEAAESAEHAAEKIDAGQASPARVPDRRIADPAFDTAPRAAEAATEVSESWTRHG